MAFEGYSIDQLNRFLALSKWILIICAVILLCAVFLNQWLAARISALQEREKSRALQQSRAARAELARAKTKTAEVTAELLRYTAPRHLTDEQITSLKGCLANGPHGKVVITFLNTETDAEPYAAEIAKVLSDAGFDVTTSQTVWLQLAVKGLYLCARDIANAPAHAVHIQRCFQTAGLRLRAHQDAKMYSDMNVPDDAIIFVVSARE